MVSYPVRVESQTLVYAGRHTITREGKNRYKIYLPKAMNLLWQELQGRKVRVYLIVD